MRSNWLTDRPAVPLAVAFLSGLALERAEGSALSSPVLGLVLTAGLLALAATLRAGAARRPLAIAAATATALAWGVLAERGLRSGDSVAGWRASGRIAALEGRAVQVRGRVLGLVREPAQDEIAFDVEIEALGAGRALVPLRGRAVLSCDSRAAATVRGAGSVLAWCRLRDGLRPCQGWASDRDLARGRVTSPALVEPIGRASLLRRAREALRARLDAAAPSGPGRGLARALVLGERDALDPGLVEGMAAAGTVHVLSVSGLHVVLMGGLAAWLATALGARARAAALSGALVAWLFVLLAGFSIPAIRSAALLSVAALARALGRDLDGLNALAACALISSALAPREAFTLSFTLTFGACAGLVLLQQPLAAALPVRGPVLLHALRDGLASGLAAWAGLLPATAIAFHRVQPLSPLLNLLAIPLAAAATALSLLAAALAAIHSSAAHPVLLVVDLVARGLDVVDGPGLLLDPRVVTPPAPLALAWLAAVTLAARGPRRARNAALAGAALAGLLIITGLPRAAPRNPRVTVLDVGQGQSVLVEIPHARGTWRALIDAGGWPGARLDVGERLVAPALWDRGITRLDMLVLTHADYDHRGGAPRVAELFAPRQLVLAPLTPRARESFAAARAAAEAAGGSIVLAAAGWRLGPDDPEAASLVVLWPARAPDLRAGLSSNDAGLVLQLRDARGRALALLPADVEARGERALAAAGLPPAPLLVLGHHGSRTSTTPELLGALAPRLALGSAGRANRFGHPHESVLEGLHARGVHVHLTLGEGTLETDLGPRVTEARSCGCARTSVVRTISSAP